MAVLVVEDEPDLSDILAFMLRRAGHEVMVAGDGDLALRLWRECKPDMVILDIGLPKRDGWDVCQTIHCESSVPIMIVSGADEEEDIVRGLGLGAEDYVTKPFSPKILQARIERLLRRNQSSPAPGHSASVTFGDLRLDADRRLLCCNDCSVQLTRIEYIVLRTLAIHSGKVVSHQDLVERVWGYKGESTSHVAKGHVRSLRTKLGDIGSRTTVKVFPGFGYRLENSV